jgi:predicted flap endonuclease-1-like 5' DNA nuclease
MYLKIIEKRNSNLYVYRERRIMSTTFAFILGLLIGWLLEWLIDYFFWRRRRVEKKTVLYEERRPVASEPAARVRHADVEATRSSVSAPSEAVMPAEPAREIRHDDLKVIKGIGPVIERKLNEAGIFSFGQLGELKPADLRRILGDVIERLSDEESLLEQARDLARKG